MYQQLTIVGNVGSDVEQRYTPAGVAVTTFSVAVNRTWNNAAGEKQEKTTWYRVTVWRALAEVVAKYVTKGMQVLVVADDIESRAFTDKAGENRSSLEVTATTVLFLGSRGDSQASGVAQSAPRTQETGVDEDIPF